jgi:hypothetical protein
MLENLTADGLWPYVKDTPNFKAMCRVLNDLGVLGLWTQVKRPIARELCDRLGFEPSESSFKCYLNPGAHAVSRADSHQRPSMRFSATLRNMRGRNKKLHGVDHQPGGILDDHLAALWEDAHRPDHPWAGVMDPTGFGDASESGTAGHPFALSFDRLACSLGYVPGNVQCVPNAWNKTVLHWGEARIGALVHKAVTGNVDEANRAAPGTWVPTPKPMRPHERTSLGSIFLRPTSHLFAKHPNLLTHRGEMLEKFRDDLARGTCAVTGLPFVYELNHPCFLSYDLIDPSKGAKGTSNLAVSKRCGRKFTYAGGSETPADMRLVCRFVNHGMSTWGPEPWWVVARRAAELHEAGYFTSRDS